MLDLYMLGILTATFSLFLGFTYWCDRIVGGDRK